MVSQLGKIAPTFLLTAVIVFAALMKAYAQDTSEVEGLARASHYASQVVRIIPHHIDGSAAGDGFGLLVGQKADRVYIATPYHVAFGDERPSSIAATLDVIFQDSPYDKIQARRLEVGSPSDRDDLAVLEVIKPSTDLLPRAPIIDTTTLPLGTPVWNIGIGQRWDMPDRAGGLGPQDVIHGRRRVGSLRTPRGASGGAAVIDRGILGIVLEDATDYSLVLPIERLVEVLRTWQIPTNLLLSMTPQKYNGQDGFFSDAIRSAGLPTDDEQLYAQLRLPQDFYGKSLILLSFSSFEGTQTDKEWWGLVQTDELGIPFLHSPRLPGPMETSAFKVSGFKAKNYAPPIIPALVGGAVLTADRHKATFDVRELSRVYVRMSYKSNTNPQPRAVHNCGSSLNLLYRFDANSWKTETAICGFNDADDDSRFFHDIVAVIDIPPNAASLEFAFKFYIQNTAPEMRDHHFLIDNAMIIGEKRPKA